MSLFDHSVTGVLKADKHSPSNGYKAFYFPSYYGGCSFIKTFQNKLLGRNEASDASINYQMGKALTEFVQGMRGAGNLPGSRA